MQRMKLSELIVRLESPRVEGAPDGEVTGIVHDSRRVRPGYAFVAIPGEHRDGLEFVGDALARGASVIVSEQAAQRGACWVRVRDARLAIARMACVFYGNPSLKLRMLGVTGTNGKTTVTFIARDVLAAAGMAPGLIGTVRYEIGERVIPATRTTPEAPDLQSMLAQMVDAGCASAAMEVSSHSLVQKRCEGIEHDVAVFTNLTHDHLDYHRTMEDYFEAKRLLFLGLGRTKDAAAVINIDDPWGRKLMAEKAIRVPKITYGSSAEAIVRAVDVDMTPTGSSCRIVSPWGETRVVSPFPGRFNVSNVLAVVAACGQMGIEPGLAADTISRLSCVPGRMEEVPARAAFQVFVDYAHTDDALKHVLTTLREIARGRVILVFGCGGDRDRTKRPAMGAVAGRLADHTILTSDNPRSEDPAQIIAEIRAGFGDTGDLEICLDRSEAIGRAVRIAEEGDIVLIAGKGHETFQEFANTTVPFDDRRVACAALGELQKG